MQPVLFNLGAEESLADSVAGGLEAERGTLELRSFPDGETYLRFDGDCADRPVILLQSLDRPNDKVLPLLLAAATLRDLGASRVGLIAPYLAYMRQDIRFRPGEGVTARYFGRLLSDHFDWLVTVDPHLHRIGSLDEIYRIPTAVARAAPALAGWIGEQVTDPVLIGPDRESEQWVAEVATRSGMPHLVLEKKRSGDRDVRVSAPDLEHHRGQVPVLVDDIISTGHTLIETIKHVVAMGMPPPVCVAVHAVFAEGAAEALRAAGATRVVTSNTIPHPTNRVDVAPALVAAAASLWQELE